MKRNFLALQDWTKEELQEVLTLAKELKDEYERGIFRKTLKHKTLAMIFAKPSSRTRVSFEVGMFQLGGQTIFMANNELQPGKREAVSDLAKVLSSYVDGVLIRTFSHDLISEFAQHATVPVINGLTDKCHPCQVLSDIFTIKEKLGNLEDVVLTYVGDGNNVLYSLIFGCAVMGIELRIATPAKYQIKPEVLKDACKLNHQAKLEIYNNPEQAVAGADVIYTDVWTSMGQEGETEARRRAFAGYQITSQFMSLAAADAIFMHPLPAHHGEEIAPGLIDSPQSVVFDQAENRLHVQKAILAEFLGK